MGLLSDFRKFAFKGNVIDLAVGVVVGGAFQKIVTAVVDDFVMPFASLLTADGNWRERRWVLRAGATPKDDVALRWGDFAGNVLDFFLVAFVLFLIVSKIVRGAEKRLHLDADGTAPALRECPFCFDTVLAKATRCKSCTSELETVPARASAQAPARST